MFRYLISKISLDSHQFASKANRLVDDAVALCLHSILQHLEAPNTYVRVLFVDYKSAFNTIIPVKLFDKLKQLGIQHSLALWILDFLQNRTQVVQINNAFHLRQLVWGPHKDVYCHHYCTLCTLMIVFHIVNQCKFLSLQVILH